MTDDNRRFSRIPFRVKAQLRIDDQTYSVSELSNLSVGGCLLPLAVELPPGTACLLKIMLEGTTEEMRVRVEGEVVRTTPEGVALRFLRIEPDSLFHLQNIILYNAPDADAIEHELARHPGLK
ncbi:MAG: PilZ domain-containing protein [Desulfobulbaceae bacterium]